MAYGYSDGKGWILQRRSDGAQVPDGKVRYSKQGANQALWEYVRWQVTQRLQDVDGLSQRHAYDIEHVFWLIKKHKMSLDEANKEALLFHIKQPVSNQELKLYSDTRLEIYGEWDIVEIKVALK